MHHKLNSMQFLKVINEMKLGYLTENSCSSSDAPLVVACADG